MNTKLIIWIVGIFLGVIVVTVLWYVIFAPKAAPQTSQPSASLPISGYISPGSSSSPSATTTQSVPTMTLVTQNGSSVVANDFVHNGVTIPDTANTGRYLLAGNLGYCSSDPQKCQAAPSVNFNVYYNSAVQSFTIALLNEPLGQSRLDMEQFMLSTLGLTQLQLCSLNYYIGTTYLVNTAYSDRNLGFSFCPGATVLPK